MFMYRFDEFMVPFEKTFAGLYSLGFEAYRQENIKVCHLASVKY